MPWRAHYAETVPCASVCYARLVPGYPAPLCARPLRRLRGQFFFSSRRRHTRCLSDWSSDVCSSDLPQPPPTPCGTPDTECPCGRPCSPVALSAPLRQRPCSPLRFGLANRPEIGR